MKHGLDEAEEGHAKNAAAWCQLSLWVALGPVGDHTPLKRQGKEEGSVGRELLYACKEREVKV